MTIDVTVVANDGQVIEVSVGDGAAVFEALDSISEQLATKVDAGGAAGAAPVQSVAGKTGAVALAKADVGLGSVDNTPDAAKPISTAQAEALATKTTAAQAAAAAPVQSVAGKTGSVSLAKGDVGLGAVDNTSDASKPVSTAQAPADTAARDAAISTLKGTADSSNDTLGKLADRVDGVKTTADGAAASLAAKFRETTGSKVWLLPFLDAARRLLGGFDPNGIFTPIKFKCPDGALDAVALKSAVQARLLGGEIGTMFKEIKVTRGGGWVVTDKDRRKLFEVLADGTFKFYKVSLPASFVAGLTADIIAATKIGLGFRELPARSPWLYIITDLDRRIIFGIPKTGLKLDGASSVADELVYHADYLVIPTIGDDGKQYLDAQAYAGGSRTRLTPAGIDARSPAISGNLVSYVANKLRYMVPVAGGTVRQATPTPKELYVWGDSLSDPKTGNSPYITQLQTLRPDVMIYLGGIAGQGTATILAREGSRPTQVTMSGNTIPASGSIAVTLSVPLLTTASYHIDAALPGTLETPSGSVPGRLIKDTSDAYTFARDTAGDPIACPAGTLFIPDAARAARRATNLIWIGRNDPNSQYASLTQAGYADAYAYNENLIPQVLFVGITTLSDGTENSGSTGYNRIVAHNTALAGVYGGTTWDAAGNVLTAGRFVDVRRYLIECGLTVAGVAATEADTTAIANDVIPPSLMNSDFKHFNVAGNTVLRKLFAQIFTLKGWW